MDSKVIISNADYKYTRVHTCLANTSCTTTRAHPLPHDKKELPITLRCPCALCERNTGIFGRITDSGTCFHRQALQRSPPALQHILSFPALLQHLQIVGMKIASAK